MPTSIHRSRLGRFEVSGIHSVIDKYGESGKTSIHTRVDQGGVFHLEGAGGPGHSVQSAGGGVQSAGGGVQRGVRGG